LRLSDAHAHAAARLRLLLRKSWGGHSVIAALARATIDTAYCGVHELSADRFKDW
jgi:hypothetical protein